MRFYHICVCVHCSLLSLMVINRLPALLLPLLLRLRLLLLCNENSKKRQWIIYLFSVLLFSIALISFKITLLHYPIQWFKALFIISARKSLYLKRVKSLICFSILSERHWILRRACGWVCVFFLFTSSHLSQYVACDFLVLNVWSVQPDTHTHTKYTAPRWDKTQCSADIYTQNNRTVFTDRLQLVLFRLFFFLRFFLSSSSSPQLSPYNADASLTFRCGREDFFVSCCCCCSAYIFVCVYSFRWWMLLRLNVTENLFLP